MHDTEFSWETNSSSASQEIPHILWYPMVCYHIHKHLPPFPILRLMNPMHACPSHFLKINLKFSSHLSPGFLNSPFPSGLSTNILHAPLLSPIHATCHTHPVFLYKIQHNLKKLFVSIELQHCDVTSYSLVESCWGCRGKCGLHR